MAANRLASHRGKNQEPNNNAATLKHLVQTLRGDLNMLSNEAKKKFPAVREAAERGGMRLKTLSESKGFSIEVLAETDDVIHPILFACETKTAPIVKIGLSSLQKLVQYNAIPKKSVETIVATLKVLMDSSVEELKVLQTILLLVTTSDVIQGKPLSKILLICFKMYLSRDTNVHNTAGVVIRQVVSAMFERLNSFINQRGSFDWGDGLEAGHGPLPTQASDAYLLFQDVCFLTNGDPPAWLPTSLELELPLGLELMETILRTHPMVFTKEKLFNQLLTERVCPLVVKLFSPTSKYRQHSPTPLSTSPTTASMMYADKPTFALSVRLLRILNVLIREFYSCLVTQCEIFLSMLVKFLDPDKPMWQRTLAVEVFHSFCNQPDLLRSFCVSYDMQEHSSKIFGDIVDALGGFIQSCFTSHVTHTPSHLIHTPFSLSPTSSSSSIGSGNGGHVTGVFPGGGRHVHQFSLRNVSMQVEPLQPNAHAKPICLEMLDKYDVPLIPDGYPLVVAMNSLLDAIKSVSSIISESEGGSGKEKRKQSSSSSSSSPSHHQQPSSVQGSGVEGVMLRSSWSGVLAALALLLEACVDEKTTIRVLKAHQTFILLCGQLQMTSPRDAFLTSLCKATLPPRHTMSLIAQRRPGGVAGGGVTKTVSMSTSAGPTSHESEGGIPRHMMTSLITSPAQPSKLSNKKSENYLIESSNSGVTVKRSAESANSNSSGAHRKLNLGDHEGGGGAGAMATPREPPSGLVSVKNLQCLHALLQIIDYQGNLLDSAWFLVMNTLQLVMEVYGMVPSPSGGLQHNSTEISSLSLLNVTKKDEVSEIPSKFTAVFRSTRQLTEANILKLIDALSELLKTSLPGVGAGQGTSSRDSTLFPIIVLQELGVANTSRLDVIWEAVMSQLTKACCHSDASLRAFSADALTTLIKGTLELEKNEEKQLFILMPLMNLSSIDFVDVRLKQLDCISNVLHSSGQMLRSSWSVVLEVIKSAARIQSESLVRNGFQSLQLVIADFLPAIPHSYVSSCVDMAGQYGIQTVDINISLTSIGLLWNMADYLFQNRSSLRENLLPTAFDAMWMLLFKHLSDLCVDERAAVRKSASQTLFSTITAHGTLLQKKTWKDVLWQVLFPLLEGVGQATGAASTSSFQTSILIHHTRNTAQKQWAETQVLTLKGSARLFQTRWSILTSLERFEEAWSAFLNIIKECACSDSTEVSIAAMKSFQIIVNPQTSPVPDPSPSPSPLDTSPLSQRREKSSSPAHVDVAPIISEEPDPPPPPSSPSLSSPRCLGLWRASWEAVVSISEVMILKRCPPASEIKEMLHTTANEVLDVFFHEIPSQTLLVSFMEVLLQIHPHLRRVFSQEDYRCMSEIVRTSLFMVVSKDVSPFLVPSVSENSLSSLQRLILKCLGVVVTGNDIMGSCDKPDQSDEGKLVHTLFGKKKTDYVSASSHMTLAVSPSSPLLASVMADLLSYASYSHRVPEMAQLTRGIPQTKVPFMTVNFVPFGLSCQALATRLYRTCLVTGGGGAGGSAGCAELPFNIHVDILKVLHGPLKLRYGCPLPSIWVQSLESLLLVLEVAIPYILKKVDVDTTPFWLELGDILEDYLFSEIPSGVTISSDEMRRSEDLDIKVIDMIRKDILSASTHAPRQFLEKLTTILNKGSIHSATDQFDGVASHQDPVQFREKFARSCFEALLQFSFIHSSKESSLSMADSTGQLALNALLERCEEVLLKFVADERLSGSCPLPRTRMGEVSLVLKSVTILISALKEAQKNSNTKIDVGMWHYLTKLYPALVQCVTCKSVDVRQALKEALLQFSDLLLQPEL